jgi:hypothetical protein
MLILKDSVRQNIIIQAQNILEKNRERMKTDFFWRLLLKKISIDKDKMTLEYKEKYILTHKKIKLSILKSILIGGFSGKFRDCSENKTR